MYEAFYFFQSRDLTNKLHSFSDTNIKRITKLRNECKRQKHFVSYISKWYTEKVPMHKKKILKSDRYSPVIRWGYARYPPGDKNNYFASSSKELVKEQHSWEADNIIVGPIVRLELPGPL